MNDTPDGIREEMNETRAQLVEKLQSLENQVSDTIQSAGTAVNATVAAVQNTVDSVTSAVSGAAESMGETFSPERQFDRNPWLFVGGAFVVGYVAHEYFAGPNECLAPSPPQPLETRPAVTPGYCDQNGDSACSVTEPVPSAVGVGPDRWAMLRNIGIGTLVAITQQIVSRAIPQAMNYFVEGAANRQTR